MLEEMYREDPVSLIAPVTSLLGLFGLLFLGRSPTAYILGTLALIVLCNDAIIIVWREWFLGVSKIGDDLGIVIGGTLVIIDALLLYLAYRFIFGLPSRRYYRIGKESLSDEG